MGSKAIGGSETGGEVTWADATSDGAFVTAEILWDDCARPQTFTLPHRQIRIEAEAPDAE